MPLSPLKIRRLAGLLAYVLTACAVVYFARPTYLLAIVIVLVPPAIATWRWLRRARRRVLLFSLLTTAMFAPPVELVSRAANAWDVQSVLPRPFGLMPLENILFAFLNFFWGLSFYAYFQDRDHGRPFPRRFRWLILLYAALDLVVFGLFAIDRQAVALSYFGVAAVILVLPLLLIYGHRPAWLRQAILPTFFFAAVFFAYEWASLCIGSWWWPGEYFWPVRLCGAVFPVDDVVIWYLLSTPALIGGYRFFADPDETSPGRPDPKPVAAKLAEE